jgi:hypothetical protein
MRGDTARIQYRLRNHLESREDLFTFTVDAPARVLRLSLPEPRADWDTATSYRGRSVVDWIALGSVLPPGGESPDLFFEALGIAGTVTSWVRGYYPPPRLTPADTNQLARPSDPLRENSIRLTTVGVVPFPADSSASALLARLRELRNLVCGELAWIASEGVCNSLRAKLDQAAASLSQGRPAAAQLRAFVQELEAQHGPQPGKHVNDSAYWLLRANGEYLLARM